PPGRVLAGTSRRPTRSESYRKAVLLRKVSMGQFQTRARGATTASHVPVADVRGKGDDPVAHQRRHIRRYAGKRNRRNVGSVVSDIVEVNSRVAVCGRAAEPVAPVVERCLIAA